MKKILLATTLLSVAISENILVEKYPKPMMWSSEKQFSSNRPKRASRDDILSELKNIPNYDDDRQFPQISEPRFIGESVQLPPVAIIRRFSQVGRLPADKSKLDSNVKPTVLISIGIQDKSAADDSQQDCSTMKSYRKHNQDWQLQQPFYVDEPHWINIDPEYTESSARRPDNGDPYIMSRGKKFRIKSPDKLEKFEDYEEFLDYTSKRLSTKNRVRRSVEATAEALQGDRLDEGRVQKEEMRRYNFLRDLDAIHASKIASMRAESPDEESSKADEKFNDEKVEKKKKKTLTNSDIFVDGFETDKPRNAVKESLYGRKLTKWNRTAANDTLIANSIEEEWKTESDDNEIMKIGKKFHKNHFAVDKGSARALENGIFRGHGKRGNHEAGWYNSNIDRKKTAAFVRAHLRDGYLNKIENFSTYDDLFILSRGKKPLSESQNSDKKDTKPNRSSTERWEDSSVQRYAHREEPENEKREAKEDANQQLLKTDRDDTRSADARLTTKPESKSFSGMRGRTNYREKRNIYRTGLDFREDALLRSIEQEIADSAEAYLKPRNKHGSLLDLKNHLSTDPFFFMRGKKASEATDSVTELRRNDIDDVAREMHYSLEKNLLKMLLTGRPRCNDRYCEIETATRSLNGKSVLRNRRDSLDKLLGKYDPFVIIRGKRARPDNF